MKVYFINLDRSPDRLAWFRNQGEALGLDLVRVPAVDAGKLDATEIARLNALSSGNSNLSGAEIACFLSHRNVWRIIAESDGWAFVAEDDIHFARDAGKFLRSADWIPAGVEVVKAETNLRGQELSRTIWGRPFGFELRQLHSDHFCTGGYFLSPSGARRLLDFTQGRCEPADVVLFSPRLGILRQTPVLQVTPAICLQNMYLVGTAQKELQSAIEASRNDERRAHRRRMSGGAKFRKEVRRVGWQILEPFRRVFLIATGRSVFQRVPFAGSARPKTR